MIFSTFPIFPIYSIPDYDDAGERMIQVLKWYLSSFHAGRKVKRFSVLIFCFIQGFSRKKIVPPVKDIDFFEVDFPGFPVKFTVTPLEILNFSSIFGYPLEFQRLLLYPCSFPLISSAGGVPILFWESPISNAILSLLQYVYTFRYSSLILQSGNNSKLFNKNFILFCL